MEPIQVISRDTIPPINEVLQGGVKHLLGELRDFSWHERLRDFIPPDSQFSVSWVKLDEGEVLSPHVHPVPSLMVFYKGSGRMLGDLERSVGAEDVVIVPAGAVHGFRGGPGGLFALSIQFGAGLYSVPEHPRVAFTGGEHSLASLLEHNRMRLERFKKARIFDLLEDGTLADAAKRQAYLDTLQIWVDGNQSLLYSRQASSIDSSFSSVFLQHMQEELGHDLMHKDRQEGHQHASATCRRNDSTMDAITTWFTYQMYVLDNAEKAAVIHLVIENASAAYHEKARPILARYVNDEYFEVHVEADGEHAALGEHLLTNESPATYRRLRDIVDEAWDMLEAMTDRVVDVTRAS